MMISCVSVSAVLRSALVATALALACPVEGGAQAPVPTPPAPAPAPQAPAPLPLGPARERGASITPAFEGWYQNADGSYSLLVGYFNRNTKETLDIPVGPNNRIEPGAGRSGPADPLPDRPAVGRVRDQGAAGLRHQGAHLDDHLQRRVAVDSADAEQELSDRAVRGEGHGQQAAGVHLPGGGTKFTGPPTAVAATLTGTAKQPVTLELRRGRPEADQEGLRVGVQPQRRRASPRSRSTSSAVPAR